MKDDLIIMVILRNIWNISSAEFGKFLLQCNMVASGKEKFMGLSGRKFFSFQQRRPKMSWPEQLLLFLQSPNIAGVYKEWQIRQADLTIRFYEKEPLSLFGF